MFSGEATNTYFIVFGFTRPGLETLIYRTRGKHTNHLFKKKIDWKKSMFKMKAYYLFLYDYSITRHRFKWWHPFWNSKISSVTEVFIDKISDSCGETEYSPRVPTGEKCLFIYNVQTISLFNIFIYLWDSTSEYEGGSESQ